LKSQFLLATVFQDRPTLDHKFWCSALTNWATTRQLSNSNHKFMYKY
jgi:hypothetical protein